MIAIILAVLGVPLWLLVLVILGVVIRNKGLHKRPGNISVWLRAAPGKRWKRGNAIWVHDVFAFRGFPAAWEESLLWVESASIRPRVAEDEAQLKRVEDPVIAIFQLAEGGTVEIAVAGNDTARLLGPFGKVTAQPHAHG